MKRIIIGVVFIILTLTSFGKTEILDNDLCLTYDNGIKMNISEVDNGMLRIQVQKKGIKIKENEFFINKKESNNIPLKDGDKYLIGDYKVKEITNGYELYKENELLYSSKFEIKKGELEETKECYNEEIFHGMGSANEEITLEKKIMRISQNAEYGNQARLYIPFYFTNAGDAFYYNTNAEDYFRFGRKNQATVYNRTKYDVLDYYYYYEKEPKKLVSKFYDLSESKSLLPKWVFGYLQSKYGYKSTEEVYDLVAKFKKYDIPVSGIILDLDWFKKMGDLDWDTKKFPLAGRMDQFLENNNIKLITISEPYFTNDSKSYKEFEENGLLAKKENGETITWESWWCFGSPYGAVMNPLAENAKEIIGKKYIKMKESGIDGFWTDLGEPEFVPAEAYFNEYTEKEFHNHFNNEWSKIVYETMMENYPDERPFILSRSGFTGSAKYNVSTWSGDSSSNFDIFKKQVILGINSGLSGFSYWGSDVGGFLSDRKKPDKELFIRWMQFGAFTPVFRAHGSFSPREPWMYDEKTTAIIKEYIELRYELMPYIYSTAYDTYKNGVPMMRPLFFEYPNDKKSQLESYEYMFGQNLLVAPIVEPEKEKADRKIYLPAGKWYDFYNNEEINGGNDIIIKIDINKMPVYVKEGAIIPLANDKILMYPSSSESEFTLYDDDGESNDFKKGEYEEIKIKLNQSGVELNGVKKEREIILKVLKSNMKQMKKIKYEEEGDFNIIRVDVKKGNNKIIF